MRSSTLRPAARRFSEQHRPQMRHENGDLMPTSESLRVCPLCPGGVEHHDGAVDRGQRAIGVLTEILVPGGGE